MNRTEQLKDFLLQNPADSFVQHALALEYVKAGNDDEARQLFEQLLQRDAGYVGSYYHLAKLLERTGQEKLAIEWYEKGMAAAKIANDNHAYSELLSAYEQLIF